MNRIPFSIDLRPQIEAGEYKVETRDGKEVTIIIWNSDDEKNPILGYIEGCDVPWYWHSNGFYKLPTSNDNFDLFLVPKEQPLTEFEQAIYTDICVIVTACDGKVYGDKELKPIVKGIAKELLDIARQELRKEEQEKLGTIEMPIDTTNPHYIKGYNNGFNDGMEMWRPTIYSIGLFP